MRGRNSGQYEDNEAVSEFGSSFRILLFHTLGLITMRSIGCGLLPHHVVWLCVCLIVMAEVIEVPFGM